MAKKKRPAFGGDAKVKNKVVKIAESIKRSGEAYADLDRVRAWAREGRKLLRDAIARFPDESAALRATSTGERFESTEQAYQALVGRIGIDGLTASALGSMVRSWTRDDDDDALAIIAMLMNIEPLISALVDALPTTASIDGTDAADVLMQRSKRTVEESALALKTTENAIEKRRQRRRR